MASRKAPPGRISFRVLPWPGEALDVPAVEREVVERVDEHLHVTGSTTDLVLPSEFFLRELLDVDADEPGQLELFIKTWGVVRPPEPMPGVAPAIVGTPHEAPGCPGGTLCISVQTVRLAILTLQACVQTWLTYQRDEPDSRHVEAWGKVGFDLTPLSADETGDEWALRFLGDYLTSGLGRMHPTVEVVPIKDVGEVALRRHPGYVDLWDAVCIQIYNHVVDDPVYRICANDRCGRVFFRQRGRSTTEQSRTAGVRYCSAPCAKRQSERDRYRQKKGGS